MKRLGRAVLVFAVLAAMIVAVASYAAANSWKTNFQERLDGWQEVPSVSTEGRGTFRATIDDSAQTISYTLTYSGLSTPALAAHIHLGQRSVNGGVSAFLCGGGSKPACPPGTSDEAMVSGVITPTDVIGPTNQGITGGEFDELVRAIRAGRTYANVHTSNHPGGEIRGQINDSNQRDD